MTELRNFFCIQNSFGAEFFMGMDTSKIEFTAQMGTQPDRLPHSAFHDAGKLNDTGLAQFFKERNVTEIHLDGKTATTDKLLSEVYKLRDEVDGIQIMYPLPASVDASSGFDAVPRETWTASATPRGGASYFRPRPPASWN